MDSEIAVDEDMADPVESRYTAEERKMKSGGLYSPERGADKLHVYLRRNRDDAK